MFMLCTNGADQVDPADFMNFFVALVLRPEAYYSLRGSTHRCAQAQDLVDPSLDLFSWPVVGPSIPATRPLRSTASRNVYLYHNPAVLPNCNLGRLTFLVKRALCT